MPLNTGGAGLPAADDQPWSESIPGMGGGNDLAREILAPKDISAPVSVPTKFGRGLQVASLGAYDPTGGVDSGPKPTKFGALMRVIGPALTGGLVGWAGGKQHPGGGFGAANDYFNTQRAYNMQRMLLQRQAINDEYRNELEAARTLHTLSQPNFTGRGAAPIKGRDANGNLVFMRPNPQTGAYEPIESITPDEADNSKLEMTDEGLVSVNPREATARRVMLSDGGDSSAVSTVPTTPPRAASRFDSGSPVPTGPTKATQSPSAIKANQTGRVPLRPSGFSKPRPTIRANRNAAGVETDQMIDTNPNSPTFGKDLGSTGTTRQPLPDRVASRIGNTAARKAADTARAETYAQAALQRSGGDPDKAIAYLNGLKIADPNAAADFNRLLPQIRKSVTDRTKSRKPKTKNPLGLSDEDWQALVGGPSQQSTPQEDNDE